jgi:chorismate-pyruvate lyase
MTMQHLAAVGSTTTGPIDRMVLAADGTLTTSLEACIGEPIVTRITRQEGPARLGTLLAASGEWRHADTRLLELAPTERLIARRVTLRGARSGISYVVADVLIAPDRLR